MYLSIFIFLSFSSALFHLFSFLLFVFYYFSIFFTSPPPSFHFLCPQGSTLYLSEFSAFLLALCLNFLWSFSSALFLLLFSLNFFLVSVSLLSFSPRFGSTLYSSKFPAFLFSLPLSFPFCPRYAIFFLASFRNKSRKMKESEERRWKLFVVF